NDIDIYYNQQDQSWGVPTQLSDAKKTESSAPSLTVDKQNDIYVVWMEDAGAPRTGMDIKIINCTDGVWGGIDIKSDIAIDSNSIEPQIVADDAGNLHLVWADDGGHSGSGNDFDIFYKKYNASTKTWGAMTLISDNINNGSSHKPSILVVNQFVHIVWEDNCTFAGSGNDYDILYKYWDPALTTWNDILIISDDINDSESHNTSITAVPTCDLFVSWEDNGNINNSGTDVDIVYKCWDYAQDTWSETKIISNDTNNGNSLHPTLISG
ncbi:unnamed protein product, partial [marine sediment metagenome]